jgi:hypothetical protein
MFGGAGPSSIAHSRQADVARRYRKDDWLPFGSIQIAFVTADSARINDGA